MQREQNPHCPMDKQLNQQVRLRYRRLRHFQQLCLVRGSLFNEFASGNRRLPHSTHSGVTCQSSPAAQQRHTTSLDMTTLATVSNQPDQPSSRAPTWHRGTTEAGASTQSTAAPCSLQCRGSSADHPQTPCGGRHLPVPSTRKESSSDLAWKCKQSDLDDLTVNSAGSGKFHPFARSAQALGAGLRWKNSHRGWDIDSR